MIENKPYPVDIIENSQGTPLMWFHNQELNRMEAMGHMHGPFLIYPLKTMDGATLYTLWTEAMGFSILEQSDPGSAFYQVGIFKQLDSAIKVADLMENG